ncbi:amidohydrolase family protein [Mycolicibacterium aichiense]|uniref:Amidohydrolase n=1 Tax=Mycolicibacterium aichiense TaxID=1799 RepID=A0AAD1HII8_9MYCO|nr:amidohydrolase family protein [Mycolicibacterium aichiense]MCV7021380.1 amidohydrolase family protein [Mycolicibacterium aichiense]BBX05962.1 amidohydrolase [Mycolicibacterium aichiense]STZ24698.1 amidohydrolase [Mycolicibacterium aichiense]
MTGAQRRDVPIFDADQHMYETPEALTRYLPERYRYAVQYAQMGKQTRLVINSRVSDFIPNPTFERVAAPGAHEKFFAGENAEGLTLREMQGPAIEAPAATRNPVDRIAELDRQGVVEALNYPTLASLVEHSSADDPELTLAIIHALNQWMAEHWSYVYDDRLFSTPIINLSEVDGAQAELDYILSQGARVALIKPGPVRGVHGWRSPALPEFDPFWRDVEAAGLPIVLHASYPPLDSYVNTWEPPRTQNFMAMSAFRWMVLGHREIADMITSLICHGTLTRFPRLRIASVENGSSWIGQLFNDFDELYKKMPQNFPEHPHEVFRRNIWVSPFWEGSVSDVVNTVGWDKVLFGSDYPHPEGLAEPRGFWKYAEGMDERRTYDFMGDNARRFMGLPLANPDPAALKPPEFAVPS